MNKLSTSLCGTTLRLPSDRISSESLQTSVTPTYVSKLITMRKLSPISPDSHSCTKSYVHQSLSTCTHVFLRNEKIRPPLLDLIWLKVDLTKIL
ncbi:uncharacterized protein TNIN_1821 [Trichonephila inaurata madagascariensis]|uniref:Uncharacterized protein n=1 Tax=Trichonephila inaurata madagascariensis TaxID=2747483 RepID=A0A8X6WTX2_9ARAC|nr:uncharacterized protein TNIN_1821 [Trichonephila inaurata madagascariensis]